MRPLEKLVRRIRRSYLRRMMRGFRNLKKSGKLGAISAIQLELTTHNLNIDERFFSARFFGSGLGSAELIIRQYLLLRVGDLKLNRALLFAAGKSGGKVVFAMPPQWINVLETNGFEVDRLASTLLWAGYVTAAYFYGLFTIGKILVGSGGAEARECVVKPYVYFDALAPDNIPSTTSDRVSYTIVSWYLQWQGRNIDVEAIHHAVPNVPCKRIENHNLVERASPLPMLAGLYEFTVYLRWASTALVIGAFDLLRGRWWHAFILNQAGLAEQARVVPSDLLAREYLFHNSGWFYRPLWTHEVERCGSTVSLYFYSTNCESIKRTKEMSPIPYGWEAMNWPRYLVWDEGQSNHVRRAVGDDAIVEIVGPIWFSDSGKTARRLPPKVAAIFDVQPVRESYIRSLACEFDNCTPDVVRQFLCDIRDALGTIDCYMAHKRKREIGRLLHPHYRLALKELAYSSHYLEIEPDLPAEVLIQNCDLVISMPFTSTAIIAKHADKPSIYYDPTSLVQKDDPAAHDVLVIQGKDELLHWLETALASV